MKKRALACLLLCALCLALSGCHGADTSADFQIPRVFDDSREYNLVFWAKNDTNVAQTKIYE